MPSTKPKLPMRQKRKEMKNHNLLNEIHFLSTTIRIFFWLQLNDNKWTAENGTDGQMRREME